jgi:predicted XRE-type DNA-binding protein
MTEDIQVRSSSGNVFSDLGLENPEEWLVKAELARAIANIIADRRITQVEAAELLGIDQPKVSALINGKLSGFSAVRLFRFLNALDRDVEIVVKTKPSARERAQTQVIARKD